MGLATKLQLNAHTINNPTDIFASDHGAGCSEWSIVRSLKHSAPKFADIHRSLSMNLRTEAKRRSTPQISCPDHLPKLRTCYPGYGRIVTICCNLEGREHANLRVHSRKETMSLDSSPSVSKEEQHQIDYRERVCNEVQYDAGGGSGRSIGGNGGGGNRNNDDDDDEEFRYSVLNTIFLRALLGLSGISLWNEGSRILSWPPFGALAGLVFFFLHQDVAYALTGAKEKEKELSTGIWEVQGGRWRHLATDADRDEFVVDMVKNSEEEAQACEKELLERPKWDQKVGNEREGERQNGYKKGTQRIFVRCVELGKQLMLPEGYPRSVTEDYMEYTIWRMGQIIASQISGVLTTQALLYAVGLGKGAIPTAAAVNWVLRDGIGYLSKIMLSKYGRHFDVHPKGWRLVSDVIENMSYGLELLTPAFPHLFVYLAAAAGAGRSAAGLIQAATKSCFNAGMAANRNFAEVIAKGEAQGMVSKSVGIALGIALSSYVGSSGPLLVSTFGAVTTLHVFCNLKSYQAVQLRTLNPYRASLVLAEYFRSGNVVSVKEVNGEEPIFPKVSFFNFRLRGSRGEQTLLSEESKVVAGSVEKHLELGATFGTVIKTREEADALTDVYKSEHYLLAQHGDRLMVVLKEGATPRDMLRAMVQALYIHHLQSSRIASGSNLVQDCNKGGVLRVSLESMEQQYERIREDFGTGGWICEGLIARPASNRLVESSFPPPATAY